MSVICRSSLNMISCCPTKALKQDDRGTQALSWCAPPFMRRSSSRVTARCTFRPSFQAARAAPAAIWQGRVTLPPKAPPTLLVPACQNGICQSFQRIRCQPPPTAQCTGQFMKCMGPAACYPLAGRGLSPRGCRALLPKCSSLLATEPSAWPQQYCWFKRDMRRGKPQGFADHTRRPDDAAIVNVKAQQLSHSRPRT